MPLTYPDKLIVLVPMHKVQDYRRRLSAVDDAVVVHRRPDGQFVFELRPMASLSPRTYGKYLVALAADLETGHTFIIVDRDQFIDDLQALALAHATAKEREAVERACRIVAERTRYQIRDHLDVSNAQHQLCCKMIVSAPRETKPNPRRRTDLNYRQGIPVPRSERLWNVIRDDLLDVRAAQQARAAWERWADGNRPDMPKVAQ